MYRVKVVDAEGKKFGGVFDYAMSEAEAKIRLGFLTQCPIVQVYVTEMTQDEVQAWARQFTQSKVFARKTVKEQLEFLRGYNI